MTRIKVLIYSEAAGVVLKIQPPAVLIALIESLCLLIESLCLKESPAGHRQTLPTSFGKAIARSSKKDDRESKIFTSLTTREQEITRLLGQGLKNKEIADRLCVCEITVRHHLSNIFSKLDVPDRQKLLIWAHQSGLIDMRLTDHEANPRRLSSRD